MLAKMKRATCKASTVMEAIIAALILLIAFSAGMVICSRVLTGSWSDTKLQAEFEQRVLADSLAAATAQTDQVLDNGALKFEVSFVADPQYKGLTRMQIKALDATGHPISILNRIIPSIDEK